MEVSSSHQVYIFLLSVFSGFICGAFFDVQRFIRTKKGAGTTRTFFEDFLFVIFCVATLIAFSYFFNNGEIRYYQLMGTVSGTLFYAAVLSRVFKKLLEIIFSLFINLILKPVKKLYHLILIPLKWLLNIAKKLKSKKDRVIKRILRHLKKRRKHLKKRIKML